MISVTQLLAEFQLTTRAPYFLCMSALLRPPIMSRAMLYFSAGSKKMRAGFGVAGLSTAGFFLVLEAIGAGEG